MWLTESGERKLEGAERRIFVIGVLALLEDIEDHGESYKFEAEILSQIWPENRPFVILLVAEFLLGNSPAPKERGWNAAIISEIYRTLYDGLGLETAYDFELNWAVYRRRAVLDAIKQVIPDKEDREDVPRINSSDSFRWFNVLERLFDELVVRGKDFVEYEEFVDLPPSQAEAEKKLLGIAPEYFLEVPPYLDEQAKARLMSFGESLTGEESLWFENFERTGRLV